MNRKKIHLACATPGILWMLGFLFVALKGYTIDDEFDFLAGLMAALALGVVYVIMLAFAKTRLAAGISLLALIVAVPSIFVLRAYRQHLAIMKLEAIYADIASKGQPFPDQIDTAGYEGPTCLHWYYQKHSDNCFAIAYISSSNGWAMEYPEGRWRFINYQPNGYVRDHVPNQGPE